MSFAEPDEETFRCLKLAKQASKNGGLYPTVLNGSNEQAVDLFLKNKISFNDIASLVEKALSNVPSGNAEELDCVLSADKLARTCVLNEFEKGTF